MVAVKCSPGLRAGLRPRLTATSRFDGARFAPAFGAARCSPRRQGTAEPKAPQGGGSKPSAKIASGRAMPVPKSTISSGEVTEALTMSMVASTLPIAVGVKR